MNVLKYVKDKLEEWRQRRLAGIREDIAFRQEMIRQCEAEQRLDDISLGEVCQRSVTIDVNEDKIDFLRSCERFYARLSFA